jgi:uncharacterized repeat protein (TIGR01451 family)
MLRNIRPLAAALALAIALSPSLSPTPVVASSLLPDLAMAPVTDIQIENTADGRRLLRFTSMIVNTGAGRFELSGTRTDSTVTTMSVTQRIWDSNPRIYTDISTGATMQYAGDGHNHWHVQNLESYELDRADNGVKVGTGAKTGFCFYDTTAYNLGLPGAPQSPVFTNCGIPSDLTIRMGLSVGWGDKYSWYLVGQYIDITGLSAGSYVLKATADASNWFAESNDANNSTFVPVQLTGGANSPPAAVIAASPANGPAPLNVSFSGNASSDPDGGSLSYAWDFTSDGTFDATGVTTSHAYTTPGSYTAVLKVTDSQGAIDTDSTVITVSDPVTATDVRIVKTGAVSADRNSITYQLVVANIGSNTATSVAVSDVISSKGAYTSVASTQGTCGYAASTRTVSCAIGSLDASQSATVTLVVGSLKNGPIDNTATVSSGTPDTNSSNNSSTVRLRR